MKFSKTLITTAILGFSLASFHSIAWADTPEKQFQQGAEATTRGDDQTIFKRVSLLAELGDATAQYYLGYMYSVGQGVKQNNVEAVKWYRKAAEQGNADAQANLGSAYAAGSGVRQDETKAVKWFKKAAENGSADGQLKLGAMYLLGRGIQKDRTLGKEWLGKACNNGNQQGCEYYGKLNRGEL